MLPRLVEMLKFPALVAVKMPLLSREGRTRCLVPGPTAPYPALDQALKYSAAARFVPEFSAEPATVCIVFVLEMVQLAADPYVVVALVRVRRFPCPIRPIRPGWFDFRSGHCRFEVA